MPESTIIEFLDKTAAAAGGNGGATGQSTGAAGKSTTEEGEDKTEKKDKKSLLGNVGKMLTGVLGIQVSFAAMLRQSQIATGFLGAVFQVLGAILDSFLLAFAPQLFAIVEHLARLIPIARKIGEEVALQVGNLWEHIKTFTAWLKPIIEGAWNALKGIFNWFTELAPIWKWSLGALYVLPKLFAFFQVGFFFRQYKVLKVALAEHRLKSAAQGGGGKGGGAAGLLMMIPHIRIIAIALAVATVVGASIWGIFKSKDKDGGGATLDVSGQVGKRYLPSQASQLGGTLNEAYSSIIEPFTDSVTPQFVEAAEGVNTAFFGSNLEVERTREIMEGYGVSLGHGIQSVEDITRSGNVLAEDWAAMSEEMGVLVDVTHLTGIGMDNARKLYDENIAENAAADALAKEALAKANDNWVTDITKSLDLRLDAETLLTHETDNRAKSDALATKNYQKKVTEAGAELVVGAVQSKNQFVDTTSLVYGSAQEMSESTANFLTQAFIRNEKEQQMGALAGVKAFDTYIALMNEDARGLADAAQETQAAAKAFEVMTASVYTGYEADRARREQERSAEAMNFAGAGDFGKFFDYLANY